MRILIAINNTDGRFLHDFQEKRVLEAARLVGREVAQEKAWAERCWKQ